MKRIIYFCVTILIIYSIGVIIINIPQKEAVKDQASINSAKDPQTIIQEEKLGTGAEAKAGSTVTVQYTGTLTDGKKFDSSYDRKQPFTFKIGSGEVIKGWDQGVTGLKEGGKRKLTIPPELGYGNQANGAIPANSTLLFEIELLSVNDSSQNQSPKPNL